jgi:hypothetical protein
MVGPADSNLPGFLSELNNITSKGNYQVAAKLNPVKPKTINLGMPSLQGVGGGSTGSAVGDLAKLMKAIKSQESNNNYSATNPSGASGGYQILQSNFVNPGGWDKEALGRDISYNEFMGSPQLQDQIAQYKLGQYLKKYGAAGAAAAWYGGEGSVKNMYSTTTQTGGYPSMYAYWTSVLSKM